MSSTTKKGKFILAFIFLILIVSFILKSHYISLRVLSTMALLLGFLAMDYYFGIKFKTFHYVLIVTIALVGILLSPLYFVYPSFDKVLHFTFPILYCFIVMYMISKLNLKVKWEMVFTLFIVLGSLTLFEIGEYGLDHFFDLKLQGVFTRDATGLEKFTMIQDPLTDTMVDLILGVLGTISFTLVRFFEVITMGGYRYMHMNRNKVPPHRKRRIYS